MSLPGPSTSCYTTLEIPTEEDKLFTTLEIPTEADEVVHTPPKELIRPLAIQVGCTIRLDYYIEKTQGGSIAAALHILMVVFPDLSPILHRTNEHRDQNGTRWYSRMPEPLEASHRLYIEKAAFTILYGLIKGAPGSTYQINKSFSAMLSALSRPTTSPNISTKLSIRTVINYFQLGQTGKPMLTWLLSGEHEEFGPTAAEMLNQLKLVATNCRMTTYVAIEEFIQGDVTDAHLLPYVGREAARFIDTVERLKGAHGPLFPYLKVLVLDGHEELSSTSFPTLSKVAIIAKRARDPTFRAYDASKILNSRACSIPEQEIISALTRKRKRMGTSTEDVDTPKRICGVADTDAGAGRGASTSSELDSLLRQIIAACRK